MISRIRALLSSLDLKQLDVRRIDLAMAWAQRHPLAAAAYNLGNYAFLGSIKVVQWAALSAVRLRNRFREEEPRNTAPFTAETKYPVRIIPAQPRVLILAEDTIPQCFEYRVRQKLEMLAELGWEATWLSWPDIEEVRRELHFFDVIVLYRVPGFDAVLSIIEYALSLNKLLIYDLDDLVFDRVQLEKKFSGNRGQLSSKVYRELLTGADLYRRAMSLIPFCIVSTESLKEQVEGSVGSTGFILPNGLSTTLRRGLDSTFAPGDPDLVIIFYGSGTKTHDADFMMVTPVMLELLEEHPEAKLVIAGHLQIDAGFQRFGDRVQTIELLDYASYLEVLKCAHINIAPLEPGVFADCKSEIKWLEAGMLGVPSVVSGTLTFRQAIRQGETGFLADTPAEWKSMLGGLVAQADLRSRTGHAAKAEILLRYDRRQLAGQFELIFGECVKRSPAVCRSDPDAVRGQRVLMVNTLYPPQSMGGATRVVKDLVDALNTSYGKSYEVIVFTCDVHDTRPYHLNEYVQDGVVVLSVSVPMRPDLERLYEDEKIQRLFERVLRYHQPDIVHFHSVQRLTASMLLAAAERNVPYVVTLHDSWWISDHPFMIDDRGNTLPRNISNPLVAARYSTNFNATADRNRFLRDRLRGARALIAVSGYQRELYSGNGFDHTLTLENGVATPGGFTRNDNRKLVLGYAGGKSEHKGYYFLKECVSEVQLENTGVVVIDIFSKSTHARAEKWGETPVEIHPRFDFSNIGAFYSLIDVMVVPSMWPESFGLVAREAALLGLWVIASDSGGLKGSVIEGKTGYFYPQGNRNAFMDILSDLDRNWMKYKQPVDPASVASLGINSVQQNAKATHELYQSILT
ncbi:glycosyltransferase [Pseudomonadota bacterium]